ncbi:MULTISPECIES: ABC transporter permease [Catenuloplanes]|uniref:Peptide/nickel transport system permease protein n=1 Tax=Catenuloplanes niger TaxID=587534 RepID=A0AAE3ZYV3_9ACTN|nr:ABC transporter permease [Catenuloplanes niger]MDR7327482.1 peptide/nickel transport system permease protein [Catenuloplanes niger]
MIRWALVRAPLLLAGVSVAVFAATEALPGDAALARTAGRATAAQLAALRADGGLDDPVWLRYLRWVWGLLRGDAGVSLLSDRPVSDLIGQRLPAAVILAAAALAVTVPVMLSLAWVAGTGSVAGRYATALVTATAAVPQVVVAAGLTALFAGVLGWLPPVSLVPAGGAPPPATLILPAVSLALPAAAYGAMLLRGVVADTLALPCVRDAERRGLSRLTVALRYALPPLLAPTVRILALVSAGLFAATAVVETMFGYAGLGELLAGAVANRDTPVVQAVAMLAAAVAVGGLLVADVLAAATDPYRARS